MSDNNNHFSKSAFDTLLGAETESLKELKAIFKHKGYLLNL